MAQVPTRRNPGSEMAPSREQPLARRGRDFESLFDRLWNTWLGPYTPDFGSMRLWDFDVQEDDKEIMVRAELPGFEPNEIDLQLNQNMLTIKAEKEQKGDHEEEYRRFFRSITLPTGINPDQVQANYRNGVLELHIPRAENARPRRIDIQGAQAMAGSQGQQTSGMQSQTLGQQASPAAETSPSQTATRSQQQSQEPKASEQAKK